MFRSVLVPLDGSNFGEHALSLALAAARKSGAELHLVHSVGLLLPAIANAPATGETFDVAAIEHARNEGIEAYLAAVRARILASADIAVSTALLNGDPADAILEYARGNGVDFVAMATHGRGGTTRRWLGSVAESVVRKTHLPVLLTRPGDDSPAALDATIGIGRILVPLLDAEFAVRIMPYVQSLAGSFGSQVTLLEVVIPVELEAHVMKPRVLDDANARLQAALQKAEQFLDSCAKPLRDAEIQVSLKVVSAPHAAEAILTQAEELDAQVIAMATHSRHGVARLLFGSIADKVVRGTTARAVLLCRPIVTADQMIK